MVPQKDSNYVIDLSCNIEAGVYALMMWERRVSYIYTVFILCLRLIKTIDNGGSYEWTKEIASL